MASTIAQQEDEQQMQRLRGLCDALVAEEERVRAVLVTVEEFQTPDGAAPEKTAEYVRARKRLVPKLGEYRERVGGLSAARVPTVTVEEVREREEEVRRLEREVEGLEDEVSGYGGLPADLREARAEVERRGREVEAWKRRRAGLFEGLVAKIGSGGV